MPKKDTDENLKYIDVEEFLKNGTILDAIEKDITPRELIITEIKSWGIEEDSFPFKIFVSLADIDFSGDNKSRVMTYEDAIKEVARILGRKKSLINSALSKAIKNCDFSGAKFIPILKNMDREDITKEFVVKQLLDFVVLLQ